MITEMSEQTTQTNIQERLSFWQKILKLLSNKKQVQLLILLVFVSLDIFIWTVVFRIDRQGELTVVFLDIGQGDAIYIEAPNGNQILIDGGPSGGVLLRKLSQVMPFFDRSIDIILATHPDQDHVGGLPMVIDRMDVDGVVTTENTSETGAHTAFENSIREKKLYRILARAGERIILDDGIVLEIFFPNQSTVGWETNTGSIVGRLSYGNKSFLFTGDSPQGVEKYLAINKGRALRTTVLKLGHHGSRTSSTREFISAVDPDYAIISAGKNNTYGHPHKEVTELLETLKISTISTIDHGTIIFKTDGEELRIINN